jgi:uncharacterized protein
MSGRARFHLLRNGQPVADGIERADSVWRRFMGLMGRRELPDGQGLWLQPCSSIHMFFMRIPLDAVFVDKAGRVLKIHAGIRPWRMTWFVRGAAACLELPAGWCAAHGVGPGDVLELRLPAAAPAAVS